MNEQQIVALGIGVAWGMITRMSLLRVDYRSYPSYPHAYAIHVSFGLLASLMGAVAPVALAEGHFEAVSFLLLSATQFQEIRRMERDKLLNLESVELVPRGANYIEGIAEVFENRNYLVMLVSSLTAAGSLLWGVVGGLISGVVLVGGTQVLRRDTTIEDIAYVSMGKVRLDGPGVWVDDIFIMNIASEELQQKIKDWAVGVVIKPRSDEFVSALSNVGQRQAIAHDVIHVLGNRQDEDTPAFQPILRKDDSTGKVALYVMPMDNHSGRVLKVIRAVPVLSNARSGAGQGL